MTTDHEKPVLHLLPKPVTAEDVAQLYRQLTGKQATPEEMERFRQTAAKLNAARERRDQTS
jgi:hypothetical protein